VKDFEIKMHSAFRSACMCEQWRN